MKEFKKLFSAFVCALSLGLFGCGSETASEQSVDEKEFGVAITLPGKNARAVFYDISEIAEYEIKVFQNNYEVASKTAAPGETVKIKLTDIGDYKVSAYGKTADENIIASGTSSVSFKEGDGYKNVVIDIEPYEKEVGIYAKALWEEIKEGYYSYVDAVRYDVAIYENDELVKSYENVNVTSESYRISIPWYSEYKVKISARKANLEIIGSGESDFIIKKGDKYKTISVIIKGRQKETSSGDFGVNASVNFVEGYRREKIEFGEWPQSLVDVSSLTLSITGKTYDDNLEYSDNNGSRYVKISSSYYKVEPMTWRVIGYNSDGSKKLLADKIYTNIEYYGTRDGYRELGETKIYPSYYKYSNIRAFLNSIKNQFITDSGTSTVYDIDWSNKGFLTSAFTEEEKSKIMDTIVENTSIFLAEDNVAKESTIDKIYLLSREEANKKLYGFSDDFEESNGRILKATAYAMANGAYQSSSESQGGRWWLRTPMFEEAVNVVSDSGNPMDERTNQNRCGVVPALTIME